MDIQEIVAGIASSGALQSAAAKAGIDPAQATTALQGMLEHMSANGAPTADAVGAVAAKAGLDPAQVAAFLPSIIGLLNGHAQNANEGVQSVLGGLIGSMQNVPPGSLLSGFDANKDGSLVDDAMGLVTGLFSHKT
jgi:hypothetical protein